jgi:DNA-binding CsgD family transcriptional regulator
LAASRLTNVDTGRRLGISERTVNKHLEDIFATLDVTKRTAAAALWNRMR